MVVFSEINSCAQLKDYFLKRMAECGYSGDRTAETKHAKYLMNTFKVDWKKAIEYYMSEIVLMTGKCSFGDFTNKMQDINAYFSMSHEGIETYNTYKLVCTMNNFRVSLLPNQVFCTLYDWVSSLYTYENKEDIMCVVEEYLEFTLLELFGAGLYPRYASILFNNVRTSKFLDYVKTTHISIEHFLRVEKFAKHKEELDAHLKRFRELKNFVVLNIDPTYFCYQPDFSEKGVLDGIDSLTDLIESHGRMEEFLCTNNHSQ